MEKQYKYKVIIPNPDTENETIEKLLHEKSDVLTFLEINSNTFQRICNGTLKCSQKETQRLFGIKIEKLKVVKVTHKKEKINTQKEKANKFAKLLLTKI